MPERRSSRAKKAIKYSGFDDLSDDDFADTSPAPPKKQKVEKSSNKKEDPKDQDVFVSKTVADVSVTDSGRKRRTPLSDKVYERELQQALEMSLLQSQDSQDLQESKSSFALEHSDTLGEDSKATTAFAVKDVPGVIVDEEIEVHQETSSRSNKRERSSKSDGSMKMSQATPKGKSKSEKNDCNDYTSDNDFSESSCEEEESDENSDFSATPEVSNKKKTPVKKTATSSKKSKKEATPREKKSQVPAKPSQKSSLDKSPAMSQASNLPSAVVTHTNTVPSGLTSGWKPPAFAKSVSSKLPIVKSPTSGLRLGLSRNQRVKPLHPSVRVT